MEKREQLKSLLKGIPTSKNVTERIAFYDNFYRLYGYDFRDREGLTRKGSLQIKGRPDVPGLDEDDVPF